MEDDEIECLCSYDFPLHLATLFYFNFKTLP